MDLNKIKTTLLKLDKNKRIKFMVLFGSVLNKSDTPLSDIDIAVYYKAKKEERFKFRIKALGELPKKIDLQIFQDLPLPVKKEILGGKILYYDDYQFIFDQFMKVIKEFNTFEKYYNEYLVSLREEART